MKLQINQTIFEAYEWTFDPKSKTGTLEIHNTSLSIPELITAFGSQNNIIEYDDEDHIKMQWYNASIQSITELSLDPHSISITFRVTLVSDNTEQILQSNIDECIGGVMEIAEMIATAEGKVDQAERNISSMQTFMDDIHSSLNRLWSLFNTLADRVATLENHGIPVSEDEEESVEEEESV